MPYKVRKKGDKWEVINKDTGESKGISESHEMAMRHMKALYMAEHNPEDMRSKAMRKKIKK